MSEDFLLPSRAAPSDSLPTVHRYSNMSVACGPILDP